MFIAAPREIAVRKINMVMKCSLLNLAEPCKIVFRVINVIMKCSLLHLGNCRSDDKHDNEVFFSEPWQIVIRYLTPLTTVFTQCKVSCICQNPKTPLSKNADVIYWMFILLQNGVYVQLFLYLVYDHFRDLTLFVPWYRMRNVICMLLYIRSPIKHFYNPLFKTEVYS